MTKAKHQDKILCSACLLGINCRYNGRSKPNKQVMKLAEQEKIIPVCPEILGGFATPREPAEQKKAGSKPDQARM